MRILFSLPLCAGFFASSLAAITVDFQVSSLGSNAYRYTYLVSGFTFLTNQELEIRFDPTLYGTLSNGVAGGGFNLVLLQPNNPPGVFGDYSALALVDRQSLASGALQNGCHFPGLGTTGLATFFGVRREQHPNRVGRYRGAGTCYLLAWRLGSAYDVGPRRSGKHVFGSRLSRRNGKQEDAV